LPQRPNDLWQIDVTYIHIPGYGWWYAVTVIDYFSRYLMAAYLTDSYSAQAATAALAQARSEPERIHGPLERKPFVVTDNGPSFVARRFTRFVASQYAHVRIAYRTRRSWVCWSDFAARSSRKRCTGVCMRIRPTPATAWPSSTRDTTCCDRIGR
jgi:transposase InsO family protein